MRIHRRWYRIAPGCRRPPLVDARASTTAYRSGTQSAVVITVRRESADRPDEDVLLDISMSTDEAERLASDLFARAAFTREGRKP